MPAARALAFGSSNSERSGVSKAKAAGDAPKRSDDAAPCRIARLLLDGEAPDGARRATHTAVSANMLGRIPAISWEWGSNKRMRTAGWGKRQQIYVRCIAPIP